MVNEDRAKIQGLNLLREFEGKPIYSDCAVNPVQSLAKLASPLLWEQMFYCATFIKNSSHMSNCIRSSTWRRMGCCKLLHFVPQCFTLANCFEEINASEIFSLA